jgi:hypothetical protein
MEKWGNGEMGEWGNGGMGRWGDGEMGGWGDGGIQLIPQKPNTQHLTPNTKTPKPQNLNYLFFHFLLFISLKCPCSIFH